MKIDCRPLVVLDGDDTLWATEPLYDMARARVRCIVSVLGGDADRWERVERKLDLERVKTEGYGWARFPGSCVLAFREVEPSISGFKRLGAEAAIVVQASRVFFDRPAVMPDVIEVLTWLSKVADLVLLTKGQPLVQRWRIRQSGLRSFFDRCIIVREKNQQTFAAIANEFGYGQPMFSVGNSLASDVAPAHYAGFVGVHVQNYAWAYETRTVPIGADAISSIAAFRDLISLVKEQGGVASTRER